MSKMEFLQPVVAEKYQIWFQILSGSFFKHPVEVENFTDISENTENEEEIIDCTIVE